MRVGSTSSSSDPPHHTVTSVPTSTESRTKMLTKALICHFGVNIRWPGCKKDAGAPDCPRRRAHYLIYIFILDIFHQFPQHVRSLIPVNRVHSCEEWGSELSLTHSLSPTLSPSLSLSAPPHTPSWWYAHRNYQRFPHTFNGVCLLHS